MSENKVSNLPEAGFSYSRNFFENLTNLAISHAKKLGASDAAAHAIEGIGLSTSVRMGDIEVMEKNRDKSLDVTVFHGLQRGSASTSDFSKDAILRTVQAAWDIARFTAADDCSNLPDKEDVSPASEHRDLDLFHPWDIDAAKAKEIALECEAAAFAFDQRIKNSEGASVSVQQSHFYTAYTNGFAGGYASSRHSISAAMIAESGDEMKQNYWYSSELSAGKLESPTLIGQKAAKRAVEMLGAKKISTRTCPVLFDPMLSAGLLGALTHAISGGSLYRKTSFLLDSLGKQILPAHIDIFEDPFILQAKGSSPFDGEGVRVNPRQVINAGVVNGYFLNSYSARKLKMKTTGNAGGSHNLLLSSRLTSPQDDLQAMFKKMGTGLFVTELMGQGVNYVTGDYSRGAAGFWVENGEIIHPVEEITIAGNLKDMLLNIIAIGADVFTYGAKTTGSILIEKMTIAGN